MTTKDYLAEAKRRLNTTKDADLARSLHISRSALCQINRRGTMSEETAARLGDILEMEPAALMLDMQAAKSQNKRFVASVRRLLKQAGFASVTLALTADQLARCILCKMPRGRTAASAAR